jgi:hypothetical protein
MPEDRREATRHEALGISADSPHGYELKAED